MAHFTDRPSPRTGPIDPKEKSEILHELLEIERARLVEACRIEKERRIVFPETTVIIKDIKNILAALTAKGDGKEVEAKEAIEEDGSVEALLRELTNE